MSKEALFGENGELRSERARLEVRLRDSEHDNQRLFAENERLKRELTAANATAGVIVSRLKRAYEALVSAHLGHEALVASIVKRAGGPT
jgi:hypothetical protein